jgi:general secretion pathway protein D
VNRGTGGGPSFGPSARGTGPRQYRSNTELGDAIIQIDPETRSLVIVTDQQTHDELTKVIRTLDQPKPQVLIKVMFVEVTYNKGLDLGLSGSYTANMKNPIAASTGSRVVTTTENRATDSGGTRNTVTTLNTPLGDAAVLGDTATISSVFGSPATGSFVRLVSDDWSVTLHALASKGKVEILSRPSIMARNNQEAVIVVGQEVPFVTNSRITDTGQTINTVTYDNVGIILRVTPFITSEGTVEMIVAPEISSLTDQTVPISNTVSSPVIAKRSAETVVVTPDTKTVVIGGLMETQKVESVQKVPLLGDIPLLGAAFRRTIKNDVKRELLIFLTPFIVNRPSGLGALTSSEIKKTELMRKAFTSDDLDRYLDGPSLFPDAEPSKEEVPVRKAAAPKPKTTTVSTKAPTSSKAKATPKPPTKKSGTTYSK